MKIGIMSDMHLGNRQYGSIDREKDFYKQYLKCISELSNHDIDILVLAGDLFDKANPSPEAIQVCLDGLKELNPNIGFVAIKGNHTMLMRENHYCVDNLISSTMKSSLNFEYNLLEDSRWSVDGVSFTGISYRSDSNLEDFLNVHEHLTDSLNPNDFNILIIHQAVSEFCGFTGVELKLENLFLEEYDLIICGHIHSHLKYGDKRFFLQPGSTERMNTAEAKDAIENGKGVWIIDTETRNLEFIDVPFDRKFFIGEVEFNSIEEIEEHFEWLEKEIEKEEEAPIISYTYHDNSGNIVRIRELMKHKTKKALLNNSNVYDLSEEELVLEISENEMPTVAEAIGLSGKLKGKELKLAQDIYEAYNKGLDDTVEGLLKTYFEKEVKKEYVIDSSDFDKEIEEYEEFFNNLGGKLDV